MRPQKQQQQQSTNSSGRRRRFVSSGRLSLLLLLAFVAASWLFVGVVAAAPRDRHHGPTAATRSAAVAQHPQPATHDTTGKDGNGAAPGMARLTGEKYIGMALALTSSALIGSSFVLTKKGLISTSSRYGSGANEGFQYVKNIVWWSGMAAMAIGELCNFAAYSFAPAILVTPLGALSVIIGAVLASVFLGERINTIGKAGCALCILGSVIVILHAPEEKPVDSVDDILLYATQPGFLLYAAAAVATISLMIWRYAPRWGTRTPLVYITICSLAGSLTVVACKGFGVALKLTFAGHNQLTHLSTYVFAGVVLACILIQTNYFNKSLAQFATNIVTPIYYVMFTTATIVATVILFQGFEDTDVVDIISLLSGFITIFIGVFLLNSTRDTDAPSSADAIAETNRRRKPSHTGASQTIFDASNGNGTRSADDDGGDYIVVPGTADDDIELGTTSMTNVPHSGPLSSHSRSSSRQESLIGKR